MSQKSEIEWSKEWDSLHDCQCGQRRPTKNGSYLCAGHQMGLFIFHPRCHLENHWLDEIHHLNSVLGSVASKSVFFRWVQTCYLFSGTGVDSCRLTQICSFSNMSKDINLAPFTVYLFKIKIWLWLILLKLHFTTKKHFYSRMCSKHMPNINHICDLYCFEVG